MEKSYFYITKINSSYIKDLSKKYNSRIEKNKIKYLATEVGRTF